MHRLNGGRVKVEHTSQTPSPRGDGLSMKFAYGSLNSPTVATMILHLRRETHEAVSAV